MSKSREEKETNKNKLKDQMQKTLLEQGDALSIETAKTIEAATAKKTEEQEYRKVAKEYRERFNDFDK